MSYLSTYTGLVLLDSRNQEGTLALPSASSVQGRAIYFKDEFGAFGLSSVTLSTIGIDTFENGETLFELNQTNGFGLFIASSNTWFRLSGTSNTEEVIDSLNASSIIVSTISTYGLTVTGSNTLRVYGSSIFETVEAQRFTKVSTLEFGGFGSNTLAVNSGTLYINGTAVGGGGGASGSVFSTIQTSSLQFEYTDIVSSIFGSTLSTQIADIKVLKYLGNQWFAGGISYASPPLGIAISADGRTWIPQETPINGIYDIDYNSSNLYVAVGTGNESTILTSTDGSNWSLVPQQYDFVNGQCVKWASSIWMVGGTNSNYLTDTNGSILTSYDANTWTPCSTSYSLYTGLDYNPDSNLWMASGAYYNGGGIPNTIISQDATTWTPVSAILPYETYRVRYLSSLWVLTGSFSGLSPPSILISADTSNWESVFLGTETVRCFDVAYASSQWVLVGEPLGTNYQVATSPDLCNWTGHTLPANSNLNAIGWNGTEFIAGGWDANGNKANLAFSPNGSEWFTEFSTISTSLLKNTLSVQSNSLLVVDGSQTILVTHDLVSTVEGLNGLGYVTNCNMTSTSLTFTSLILPSTVAGLGTLGYFSSFFLVSTTAGIADSILPSTVVGLGTLGYVSTAAFLSTTSGLDTLIQNNTAYFKSAWSTYTVEWHATTTNPSIGNGGLSGRFQQIGKDVSFFIDMTGGTTTTFGTGDWSFSLPVPAFSTYSVLAHATMYDTSALEYYQGLAFSPLIGGSTSSINIIWNKGAQVGQGVDTTTPFNWSSNDQLNISGSYEAL